jgi:hypothetical protein
MGPPRRAASLAVRITEDCADPGPELRVTVCGQTPAEESVVAHRHLALVAGSRFDDADDHEFQRHDLVGDDLPVDALAPA